MPSCSKGLLDWVTLKIKSLHSFSTSGTTAPTTQHPSPEYRNSVHISLVFIYKEILDENLKIDVRKVISLSDAAYTIFPYKPKASTVLRSRKIRGVAILWDTWNNGGIYILF